MATFYIEAVEATDIALVMVGTPTIGTVKYGVNDTTCPNTYTVTTASTPISLTAGQKCYWTITSTSTAFAANKYLKFTSTAKINVGGNMSDLIGGESKIPRNFCFASLFSGCTTVIDASNLVVVSDLNSKANCYRFMFQDCTSLTIAPALPATTLANYCYNGMFKGCTSLTIAPELPATTLTSNCYNAMFQGCTSLTNPPTLPATTLASNCYSIMFHSCTSLKTLPILPSTTLASNCYSTMFYNCSSIKLSETQTAECPIPYRIPSEGVGTIGTNSLVNMFGGTGGTFTGTPTINTTYYLASSSSPISITYKGQELVNFETGSKTLKCGGKYMEGDVIIAREIGTDNVAVLYNSDTILTFQNGTKTLKCAGKCMATDLVIQIS